MIELFQGPRADEVSTDFIAWKLLLIYEYHSEPGSNEMASCCGTSRACANYREIRFGGQRFPKEVIASTSRTAPALVPSTPNVTLSQYTVTFVMA